MAVTQNLFGYTKDLKPVHILNITNAKGMKIRVLTYGAAIHSVFVPDRDGKSTDVCLGYNTVAEYENGTGYFGATLGRCTNRIAKGRFTLNGVEYHLTINENGNTLHSGCGFDKKVFSYDILDDNKVKFSYTAADGEEGFPGRMDMSVTYTLSDDNEIIMDYSACADKDTVANFTNHTYFNLNGEGVGDILDHDMQIFADYMTVADSEGIPTGELGDVTGTPFDFRVPKKIGRDINLDNEQLRYGNGFDHNFAVDLSGKLHIAAKAHSEKTGITLSVLSTMPGLQFYAGNGMGDLTVGKTANYPVRSGFCLEAQYFPNSPNIESFPSVTLRVGETFSEKIIFKFDAE